jgi:DNA polymerase-3 subunit beta
MGDLVSDVMHDPPLPPTLTVTRPPAPVGPGLSIELDKHVLHALADRALPTVPSRDVLPVLKHLHLTAEHDTLQVRATSLDRQFVTHTALTSVHRPGTALLPAKRLGEILRLADEGVLTLAVLHGVAKISVGRSTWQLRTHPERGYPAAADLDDVVWHDTNRSALLRAITTVRYAAARGDRVALMALDVSHGQLTACDGSRFHQVAVDAELPTLRLPVGALDDVTRLLGRYDADLVSVGQTDRHLVLRLGPDTLLIHQLSGHAPDMQAQLLRPALENRHSLTVHRTELMAAIRRVRVNADPETCAVRLRLETDQLVLSASDRSGNSATEVLDVQWDHGTRQFSVHHGHLLELLAAHTGQDCVLWLGTDTATRRTPLLVRSADNNADDADQPSVAVLQQMLDDRPEPGR